MAKRQKMKTLLLILFFPVLAHGFVIDFTTLGNQEKLYTGLYLAGTAQPAVSVYPYSTPYNTELILYDGNGICPYDVDSYCGNGRMLITFTTTVSNLSFVAYGLEYDDFIWMGLWNREQYLGFVSASDSCPFADCDPYEQLVHIPFSNVTDILMEFGDTSGGAVINLISGTIPLPAAGWFFMSALLLSATGYCQQRFSH